MMFNGLALKRVLSGKKKVGETLTFLFLNSEGSDKFVTHPQFRQLLERLGQSHST